MDIISIIDGIFTGLTLVIALTFLAWSIKLMVIDIITEKSNLMCRYNHAIMEYFQCAKNDYFIRRKNGCMMITVHKKVYKVAFSTEKPYKIVLCKEIE